MSRKPDEGAGGARQEKRALEAEAREELRALEQQAEEDLGTLDHDELVRKYLELQRAYVSALNAVMLFKRQLSALRDHTLKSSQIADLSRKVNIADIDIISNVAVRDIPLFFKADFGALFLFDPDTRLLVLHNSWPRRLEHPPLHLDNDEDTLLVHFLRNARDPLAIASPADYEKRCGRELRPLALDEHLAAGGLLCPLAIGTQEQEKGMLVGVLAIAGKQGGFGMQDLEMATMMAEMAAAAISTSRLIEQMSRLAETDGLTQLYNHRHFQQELDRAIAASRRYSTPLSLVMLDIDHFKRFNDKYGHQAGDQVLKEVARCIRMAVREQVDIAARYGGEEFTIIMPNTGMQGAMTAAERIRTAITRNRIKLGAKSYQVSVSVGVAQYAPGQNKGEFIDAADLALYQAKRQGRNLVVTSDGAAGKQ